MMQIFMRNHLSEQTLIYCYSGKEADWTEAPVSPLFSTGSWKEAKD